MSHAHARNSLDELQSSENVLALAQVNSDRSLIGIGHSCNVMLELVKQWLETWRQTGNPRHLDTAVVCNRMARERFSALMGTAEIMRSGQDKYVHDYEAEVSRTIAQIRHTFEEIGHTLKKRE